MMNRKTNDEADTLIDEQNDRGRFIIGADEAAVVGATTRNVGTPLYLMNLDLNHKAEIGGTESGGWYDVCASPLNTTITTRLPTNHPLTKTKPVVLVQRRRFGRPQTTTVGSGAGFGVFVGIHGEIGTPVSPWAAALKQSSAKQSGAVNNAGNFRNRPSHSSDKNRREREKETAAGDTKVVARGEAAKVNLHLSAEANVGVVRNREEFVEAESEVVEEVKSLLTMAEGGESGEVPGRIRMTMHVVIPLRRRGWRSGKSLRVESYTGLINGSPTDLHFMGEKLAETVRNTTASLVSSLPNISVFLVHEPTGQYVAFNARDLTDPTDPAAWVDQISGVIVGKGLRQRRTKGAQWAHAYATSKGYPAAFGPNSPSPTAGISRIYCKEIRGKTE